MIKVKADKELFERIQNISHRVMAQAGFVQNDMELEQEDIKNFMEMSNKHIEELKQIKKDVLAHVVKCNE